MSRPRAGAWVLGSGARRTVRRFRATWRQVPERARRAWLLALTAGWAATAVLMLLLVRLTQALEASGALDGEEALLLRLAGAIPLDFSLAMWAETPGNAVFLVPITLTAAVIAARLGRPIEALSLLGSFFMVGAVVMLGWNVWDRPRPDVVQDGLGAPGISAFPSGHVAQLVSVLGLLVHLWARRSPSAAERLFAWGLFAVVIGIVGAARLVLGSHWPTDLAGGALVGGVWLAVTIACLHLAERLSD